MVLIYIYIYIHTYVVVYHVLIISPACRAHLIRSTRKGSSKDVNAWLKIVKIDNFTLKLLNKNEITFR